MIGPDNSIASHINAKYNYGKRRLSELFNRRQQSKSIEMNNDEIPEEKKDIEEKISNVIECPICTDDKESLEFITLTNCSHYACNTCYINYILHEVSSEKYGTFECPACDITLHPSDIKKILDKASEMKFNDIKTNKEITKEEYDNMYEIYEKHTLRLGLHRIGHIVWCPTVDCFYAVQVENMAKCPKSNCPICKNNFCCVCRTPWHPGNNCKKNMENIQLSRIDVINSTDTKPCPNCGSLIYKIKDGSCNHMICSICRTSFCWLCMEKVSDFHFIAPNGCTYYGNQQWSKNKRITVKVIVFIFGPVIVIVPMLILGVSSLFTAPYLILRNSIDPPPTTFGGKLRVCLTKTILVLLSPFIVVTVTVGGILGLLGYIYIYCPYKFLKKKLLKFLQK